jgi:hypothetical protein
VRLLTEMDMRCKGVGHELGEKITGDEPPHGSDLVGLTKGNRFGMTSRKIVASMKPAPMATRLMRGPRSCFDLTIRNPPSRLPAAARRPNIRS